MSDEKKILVLTSIFPADDLPKTFTPVVYYFVKEWIKMGYSVRVIHNLSIFPVFYYKVASKIIDFVTSVTGTTIPLQCLNKVCRYFYNDVEVIRIPLFKFIPHYKFSTQEVKKNVNQILEYNQRDGFIPDIILGHWGNPQLEMLVLLKEYYKCKSSLVLHNSFNFTLRLYKKEFYSMINKLDYIGFRSWPLLNEFQYRYPNINNLFICQSGIPSEMLVDISSVQKDFSQGINKFVFVGMLIQRKYPEALVKSIPLADVGSDYSITYIGEGVMKKRITKLIRQLNVKEHVRFLGHISRSQVRQVLLKCDCLVMISKDEAFGLVYLEAMGAGCIVIAAKNEGFDGIIEHGVNGFLCTAGDSDELTKLISHINQLSVQELNLISNNAINTAHLLTDDIVAKNYLISVNMISK